MTNSITVNPHDVKSVCIACLINYFNLPKVEIMNSDDQQFVLQIDNKNITSYSFNSILESLFSLAPQDVLKVIKEDSEFENLAKKVDELKFQSDEIFFNFLVDILIVNTFVSKGISASVSDVLAAVCVRNTLEKVAESSSGNSKKIFQNGIPVLRWFDHLQNLNGLKEVFEKYKLTIQMPFSPFYAPTTSAATPPSTETPIERPLDDIDRLEIIVGKVIKAWPHPDADGLYCENVDMGPTGVRNIASGLRAFVPQETLEGSLVCVLANMKPKNLRGFTSHGMLMCASNKDHTAVELMVPPPGSQLGERVSFGSSKPNAADEILSNKANKNPLEVIFPELRTGDDCSGMFRGKQMQTACGIVKCATIKDGFIS